MLIFLFLVLLLFTVPIILFSFPRFSPIPYFPTNRKDIPLILKALQLKNNQTIVDVGAGDGIVIFESAREAYTKKLNTKFVAIDINPVLVSVMHLRRLFHPNKKNIQIVWNDLFKTDYNRLLSHPEFISGSRNKFGMTVVVYLYVSPWLIEKINKHVVTHIQSKKISFVTYYYPIPSNKKKEKKIRGINSIFRYS